MAPFFQPKKDIRLLPVPDASPQDPLNWSTTRKWSIILAVTFASFSSLTATTTGNLAYPVQAEVYQKSTTTLSYTSAAAIGGVAAGPLVLAPLSALFERNALIFWSQLLGAGVSIWSACMTGTNDFVPFLISRILAGLLASLPGVFGSSIIMDICFLHDRGKAFLVYAIGTALGNLFGFTFGGYIVATQSWTVVFWWVVPLQFIAAAIVLLVCKETAYTRGLQSAGSDDIPEKSRSSSNRLVTIFPRPRMVKSGNNGSFLAKLTAPYKIAFSPVGATASLFLLALFGWVIMLDILTVVFLETPTKAGGYGFNLIETANISWAIWVGLFAAQLYGILLNDTIPLWICKRFYQGVWRPELRLHCIWPSMILMPVGLGLYGATLAFHYHYMVLAVAIVLVVFAGLLALPIMINYLSEIFENNATDCIIVLNFFRLGWGVAIPFFLPQWEAADHVKWVFGIAAFITIGAGLILIALMVFGAKLRKLSSWTGLIETEAGETLFEKTQTTKTGEE